MKHRIFTGVLVVLLSVSTSAAATARGAQSVDGWSLVRQDAAGLGVRASFDALVSSADALLLAGSRPGADATRRATIWRSHDGLRWNESTHPNASGTVNAIAVDGDRALATGGTGLGGETDFVWRSADGGQTWTTVASGTGLFGTPAPQMGRPSVSGLTRHDGWWIASGGRSDGYAAVWVSRDGARWREVLGPNGAGAASIVDGRGGSLLASWVTTAWFTDDPTKWGAPQSVSVPGRWYVSSVAPGAAAAVADNLDRYGLPTPLLRSSDGGRSWQEDPGFLAAFPDAHVRTIGRAGGLWVAAGASGAPSHVDAWVSTDRRSWTPLPSELYGGVGGALALVAALEGRVVVAAAEGELDRYYTIDRDALGR